MPEVTIGPQDWQQVINDLSLENGRLRLILAAAARQIDALKAELEKSKEKPEESEEKA